jgi:hypothetical protein
MFCSVYIFAKQAQYLFEFGRVLSIIVLIAEPLIAEPQ